LGLLLLRTSEMVITITRGCLKRQRCSPDCLEVPSKVTTDDGEEDDPSVEFWELTNVFKHTRFQNMSVDRRINQDHMSHAPSLAPSINHHNASPYLRHDALHHLHCY
jgi:hypothetical protein